MAGCKLACVPGQEHHEEDVDYQACLVEIELAAWTCSGWCDISGLEAIPCGSAIRKMGRDMMFEKKMLVVQVRLFWSQFPPLNLFSFRRKG